MTQTPPIPNRKRVLTTDEELHQTLEFLLQGANQRQVWLIMLGEDKCVAGPLMPMADYPIDPGELIEADDLGSVTFSRALLVRSSTICGMAGGRELVFVWERPGSRDLTPSDIAWARAVEQDVAVGGAPLVRAQFVLHDRGLRQLRPDDLV
ncbi:hypothetical protein G7066_05585 [Leucobacter coleopterorum]|uniref:Uncharacterized protein n=1 Tax=Leucobacter coleopterorum TaxID=2714933 RepID=A0ABX6JWA4_9MICO|nr:hypothetical protein [Leucobacter coleopterorum]QIM18256.1 hypothetical protein G7066_05585 [Leucobacter coleopterorum]